MEDEKELKEHDTSKSTKKVNHEQPILLVIGALAIGFLGFTFGMIGRPGHMGVAKQDYAVNIAHKGMAAPKAEMGVTKSHHGIGHGVSGQVTKIDGNTVTVKDGTTDISVSIVPETSLYKNGDIAKQTDVQVGNAIMVQGRPNALGIVVADVVIINS